MNHISRIIETTETSEKSKQAISPKKSTFCVADFHVKAFQLLEKEKGLRIKEVRSFLTLREYCRQKNLDYSFWKTYPEFYLLTTAGILKRSSVRLQNWGTVYNGKCLTANISRWHKTDNVCILSDIVERNVHPRFFLSRQQIKTLLARIKRNRGLEFKASMEGRSSETKSTE